MENYYDASRYKTEQDNKSFLIQNIKAGRYDNLISGAYITMNNHISIDTKTFKMMLDIIKEMK